jgi:alcohol dehydrogenase
MSQRVIFEFGGIKKIGDILSELRAGHPLIVTGGKSYITSGAKEKIDHFLQRHRRVFFSVSTTLPELPEVKRGVNFFQNGGFDIIIAVGGGTVLDVAKLIRYFSARHTSIPGIIQNASSKNKKGVPLIAIPTTAGSGAEATHFAVLYLDKIKQSITHPNILPNIALVDPALTLSTPKKLAAASGMDALSQGIESYWSVNATKTSRKLAKQAITLASSSIVPAVCNNNLRARVNLSQSALFAGQAINISRTTAPHAISYTITANFGVPHGHAVALTLGEFLKIMGRITDEEANHPLGKRYTLQTVAEICKLLGAPDPVSANNYLSSLMTSLGLGTRLLSMGIERSDFDPIIENVNLERLSNHPQKITANTIRMILNNIS